MNSKQDSSVVSEQQDVVTNGGESDSPTVLEQQDVVTHGGESDSPAVLEQHDVVTNPAESGIKRRKLLCDCGSGFDAGECWACFRSGTLFYSTY